MQHQPILEFEQVDAIERNFTVLLEPISNKYTRYATHGLHRYPATFIPQFPAFFIPYYSTEGDLVLDPMCGAGTTLIEAALRGRRFYGCDIDPVAALISRVATTPLPSCRTESEFRNRIEDLLSVITRSAQSRDSARIVLPSDADFPNFLLWFREEVLRELLLIRDVILEQRGREFRDFALLCLSSIVRDVSNADPRDIFPERDASNPVRERKDTFSEFEKSIWRRAENVVDFSKKVKGKRLGEAVCGDGRRLEVEDGSAQLVFTSPPYAYAIDYARVQKLSTLLIFMRNGEFREYRRKYVGTDRVSVKDELDSYDGIEFAQSEIERVFDADRKCGLILQRYFRDMHDITQECYRKLRPGGYLIYVVGNSTVRKTTFRTNEVFKSICRRVGLEIERTLERPYYIYRMSRKRNTQSNTVKSDFFIVAKKTE